MLRSDFTYNGRSLSDFYMKMYDPDDVPSMPSRTIEKSEIGVTRERPHHYGAYFSDVKTHHFRLIHDPEHYATPYDLRLTDREINEIVTWLMQPEYPEELVATIDDESISVIYRGLFTDVKYFTVGQDCYGLDVTFTCDAPYGYSPLISKRFKMQTQNMNGIFSNDLLPRATFLPPVITVTSNDGTFQRCAFSINNLTDLNGQRPLLVWLPEGYCTLQIDCDKKRICAIDAQGTSTLLRLSDLGVDLTANDPPQEIRSFAFDWPRLLPCDNRFNFQTTMQNPDFTVEVQTRYIIHAGGF